jgi:PKD repeat protein
MAQTESVTFTANQPPAADISGPAKETVGEPVTFDATETTDAETGISEYRWFVDGTQEATTTDGTWTYTFECLGEHTVEVTAEDDGGATDTASVTHTSEQGGPIGVWVGYGVQLG